MPANQLKDNFMSALRRCELQFPWSLLKKQEAYDNNKYRYPLRLNTQPATVKLYYPILKAIWLYQHPEELPTDRPYRLVQKHIRGSSGLEIQYVVEMGLQDNSSLVVTATEKSVRITHCETDGTREAILPFQNESGDTLTAITLALLPFVLDIDAKEGNGSLAKAIADIGGISGVNDWNDSTDIPDIYKEAFYFTDAMNEILTHKMDFEFGPATSSSAAEVEDAYFNSPTGLTGALVEEQYWTGGWEPQYVKVDGSAARSTAKKKMTIGEAKAKYRHYNADRKWNLMEQMLIPHFPDDTPVMPEVIRIADRICNTQNDVNPVVNIMWRGITSFGKSTGIKQLASIMNTPLLIMTCHPAMEISEFKSTYVPAGSTEGVELDMSGVVAAKRVNDPGKVRLPFFNDAMDYIATLSQDQADALMQSSSFFMTAMMDTEMACEMLLGKVENISTEDLCALYCDVREELATAPLHKKISSLEAAGNTDKEEEKGPEFMHVVSNYVKAMVNGYIVEIQEASRIRDSGVLVGLNEFDRAGAAIPLMNGAMARRHKKAICIISDNVGYTSCRPIDPSVLRRQGMIIDSYELTKEQLLDRVKRNTGCTDNTILDTGYDLWKCVKDFCEQNSIVEGSVSATELERFVQAVYYDGLDSITDNLNDCIISKATSSIEDQQAIRTACSTIYGAVAA